MRFLENPDTVVYSSLGTNTSLFKAILHRREIHS